MAKQLRSDQHPYCAHYPSGAAILTSKSGDRENAMALAWHTMVSGNPPRYGVLVFPSNFSHTLIADSGEFVVNFMTDERSDLVAMVGGSSGRELEKFSAFQIAATSGSVVSVPVLESAFAAYECRVTERQILGDHELFIGDIVAVQCEDSAFSADGTLALDQVSPLVYLGKDKYAKAIQASYHDRESLVKSALESP